MDGRRVFGKDRSRTDLSVLYVIGKTVFLVKETTGLLSPLFTHCVFFLF